MIRIIFAIVIMIVVLIGGAFFAWRNLRMGRGDRRGAMRLAYFYFALGLISWVFIEHHVAALSELELLSRTSSSFLMASGFLWLMYLAIEPFVRRQWPTVLVSWNRILGDGFRDPLVGRDLLVGATFGTLSALSGYLSYPLASLVGAPQIRPSTGTQIGEYMGTLSLFAGTSVFIGDILLNIMVIILVPLAAGFLMVLARVLLRRTWIAIIALMVMMTLFFSSDESSNISLIPAAVASGVTIFAYFRFGLLSLMAMFLFSNLLYAFPITTQYSAWHFSIGISGMVLLLAFALYAFYTSLGGHPIFGTARFDD